MNQRALATLPTASPDQPGVSIAATFTFKNGTPITVNSGDIRQLASGIVTFSLTEPVVLGSLSDFVAWLTEKFGLPPINDEIEGLKEQIKDNPLLSSLYGGFLSFYNGIITITVLVVNRTKDSYKFQIGVTLDMVPPLNFFDIIQFDSIGVMVNKSGTSTGSPS
jgi:hypothetical protein